MIPRRYFILKILFKNDSTKDNPLHEVMSFFRVFLWEEIVMHMADALVSPAVGGAMLAVSSGAVIYSVKKIKEDENLEKKVPLMGIMSAFVFAAQMINFTIPMTGSSGHIGGGILLSLILGGPAAFISIFSVLLIQCLFFADGGLLALGCNLFNMGVIPCLIIYPYVIKPILQRGVSKKSLGIASMIGCVLSLQLGAFMVVLETFFSGISELPFSQFLVLMQPIHLAIGLAEGVVTMLVADFIFNQRKEILDESIFSKKSNVSFKRVIVSLSIITFIVAGGLSLFASSNPDGLEWSVQGVTGSTEVENGTHDVYTAMNNIQEKTAFMPDYNYKNEDNQSVISGTSVAGIVGGVIVFVFAGVIGISAYKVSKLKRS